MPRNPDRVNLNAFADKIAEARRLERLIEKHKAALSPIVAEVKAAMGDAHTGTVGGAVAVTWATTTRQTLDAKALKTEQPEMHQKYVRTTTVRTFRWADPE